MQVAIRSFTEPDFGFALKQTAREGWDSTAESFRACLAHDPRGCFVAEHRGCPVGMITTTRYARTAWLGNLIVVPDRRQQGVGRHLMTHAMEHLLNQGARTIRLEADPPGVRLYRGLGFVDEFESLRFKLDKTGVPAATPGARRGPADIARFRQADMPDLAGFDTASFVDDRRRLLALLLEDARAAYWLTSPKGVHGYVMLLPSASGLRIGPWVARDAEAAADLLTVALNDFLTTPSYRSPSGAPRPCSTVVLAVPSVNVGGVSMLESRGFTRTPSSLRMVYGPATAAGEPGMIYAIANGAMG